MVKIEGLSERELQAKENQSRLAELARQYFPSEQFKVIESCTGVHVHRDRETAVYTNHDGSTIYVDSPEYIRKATELATAHEKVLGKEVTVKKEYVD